MLTASAFSNQDGLSLLQDLPAKSVHMVLTDPPYIISRESGMQAHYDSGKSSKKWGRTYAIRTKFGEWDEKFTLDILKQYVVEFERILKPSGTCIVFFDLWKLESLAALLTGVGLTQLRFIEWVKTNPVPINSKRTYLSNAREVAIACVKKGTSTFHSEYDNGIYSYPIYQGKRGVDRIHPTQKSLPLFQELIRKHTNEGDVVVDPFGGSGTTYIAGYQERRICLSAEADADIFQKAAERIAHHTEGKLF